MKILLTGPPRIGKTTIIKRVACALEEKGWILKGFYTEEILEKGKRVGFRLVSFQGINKIFAHILIKSSYKVGRYGIDIKALDDMLDLIYPLSSGDIVVMDEIGKMECFSEKFKELVVDLLKKDGCVLGSVALKGNFFIEYIKNIPEIEVVYVTKQNRNILPMTLIDKVKNRLK